MHVAALLMSAMASPSCTTCICSCTVVVRFPKGGWGTVFPGVAKDKGEGGYDQYSAQGAGPVSIVVQIAAGLLDMSVKTVMWAASPDKNCMVRCKASG